MTSSDETIYGLLKYACGALAGVVVHLYFKVQALHEQLYADAREDAKTDKDTCEVLKSIDERLERQESNGGLNGTSRHN